LTDARNRWATAVLLAGVVLSIALALSHRVPFATRAFLYDFRVSYCAGKALDEGADPYLTEPLRSCEHSVQPFRADLINLTAPAPLPGFELVPFAALARLPYAAAAAIWIALSILAFAAIGFGLVELTRLPHRVVWPLILLPACFAVFLGQLVIVAVAALAVSALALQKKRFLLAGLAACIAAIEPHVALAALLSLALFVPRTRPALVACGIVGIALSLWATGIHGNFEYFHNVLPSQTASEIANEEQYSVAFALHRFGLSDVAALGWANASYALALVLGIATTRLLVVRGAPPGLYVLLPVAFVVLAGPYAHIHHMFFVVPAAAIVFARVQPRNPYLALALVLLATPWGAFPELLPVVPLLASVTAVLSSELLTPRRGVAALAGLAAGAFVVLLALELVPRPNMSVALSHFISGDAFPEAAWKTYVDLSFHSNVGVFAIAKIPTLAAVLTVVYVTCRIAWLGAIRLRRSTNIAVC
jgi:hypothetical protein